MTQVSKSPARIAGMFDAIATRYDLLNHLLSAGIDRRWRKRALRSLALTGRERLLDLCAGTADLAIAAVDAPSPPRHVIGIDFARRMLRVGNGKIRRRRLDGRIALVQGDATRIPLKDGAVDAITVGFGIRNIEDLGAACEEMRRVLAPGGRLAVLEFGIPRTPGLKPAYLLYFNRILPLIGRMISRHEAAYAYLPASVSAFARPQELVTILGQHGFVEVSCAPLTFGIVYLYTGIRASEGGGVPG
ncbi:MAG TPA: bifunctional demethylmenaquinone methyltransferase/2-methoxy-6-polyprenyl-1,4-benzoquinol methylase UbiE [Vicinamibacterales bacterium]|nr:bifunctional demethylmenaquinone methyltransferase/2-methoxy-6-polyprenyl-1,4-benzoquinol methylase UbiE [Vicinamibacterales bacterium]